MKVLCVTESLGPGGAERQLISIATGLKHLGYNVAFFTYSSNMFFKRILEQESIHHFYINNRFKICRVFILRKIIIKSSIDVVIAYLTTPSFISAIATLPIKKSKLIIGERGNPSIKNNFYTFFKRQLYFLADHVIFNSKQNLTYVNNQSLFLKKSKCLLIYNSIDMKTWHPPEAYSFKQNNKVKILIGASHYFYKNLAGLIGALLLLSIPDRGKLEINWYGDNIKEPFLDNSFPYLKSRVINEGLENILYFHPASHDILKKIQETDVVALLSLNEGLPNIICEAMACGKPVLASNISEIPFIISEGIEGFLIDPLDPASIAKKLKLLINQSPEEFMNMGQRGRAKAVQLFDREKIINIYASLIYDG